MCGRFEQRKIHRPKLKQLRQARLKGNRAAPGRCGGKLPAFTISTIFE